MEGEADILLKEWLLENRCSLEDHILNQEIGVILPASLCLCPASIPSNQAHFQGGGELPVRRPGRFSSPRRCCWGRLEVNFNAHLCWIQVFEMTILSKCVSLFWSMYSPAIWEVLAMARWWKAALLWLGIISMGYNATSINGHLLVLQCGWNEILQVFNIIKES